VTCGFAECGTVSSHWEHDGDTATLRVTIPANSTARVYLPITKLEEVWEEGKAVAEADGIEIICTEESKLCIGIGSGSYNFTFPLSIS
jgi:alpha-L-rhamnosidase